jgi:hypothetical protein
MICITLQWHPCFEAVVRMRQNGSTPPSLRAHATVRKRRMDAEALPAEPLRTLVHSRESSAHVGRTTLIFSVYFFLQWVM